MVYTWFSFFVMWLILAAADTAGVKQANGSKHDQINGDLVFRWALVFIFNACKDKIRQVINERRRVTHLCTSSSNFQQCRSSQLILVLSCTVTLASNATLRVVIQCPAISVTPVLVILLSAVTIIFERFCHALSRILFNLYFWNLVFSIIPETLPAGAAGKLASPALQLR